MLHDSLTVEEVVDSESALEFMKEATKLATSADLEDLSERIGTLLSILLKKNSNINSEENETSENNQSLTKAAS